MTKQQCLRSCCVFVKITFIVLVAAGLKGHCPSLSLLSDLHPCTFGIWGGFCHTCYSDVSNEIYPALLNPLVLVLYGLPLPIYPSCVLHLSARHISPLTPQLSQQDYKIPSCAALQLSPPSLEDLKLQFEFTRS